MLPTESAWAALEIFVNRWGLFFLALMLFFEHLVIIGYFSQANATLLILGYLKGSNLTTVLAIAILASISAIAGSLVSHLIGSKSEGRLKRTIKGRRYQAVAEAIKTQELMVGFIYHFSAGLRPIVPVISGAIKTTDRLWFVADLSGAFVWSAILLFLGRQIRVAGSGKQVDLVLSMISAMVLLLIVLYIAWITKRLVFEKE